MLFDTDGEHLEIAMTASFKEPSSPRSSTTINSTPSEVKNDVLCFFLVYRVARRPQRLLVSLAIFAPARIASSAIIPPSVSVSLLYFVQR